MEATWKRLSCRYLVAASPHDRRHMKVRLDRLSHEFIATQEDENPYRKLASTPIQTTVRNGLCCFHNYTSGHLCR